MCRKCVINALPDRGSVCLVSGAFIANFKACASCGRRDGLAMLYCEDGTVLGPTGNILRPSLNREIVLIDGKQEGYDNSIVTGNHNSVKFSDRGGGGGKDSTYKTIKVGTRQLSSGKTQKTDGEVTGTSMAHMTQPCEPVLANQAKNVSVDTCDVSSSDSESTSNSGSETEEVVEYDHKCFHCGHIICSHHATRIVSECEKIDMMECILCGRGYWKRQAIEFDCFFGERIPTDRKSCEKVKGNAFNLQTSSTILGKNGNDSGLDAPQTPFNGGCIFSETSDEDGDDWSSDSEIVP